MLFSILTQTGKLNGTDIPAEDSARTIELNIGELMAAASFSRTFSTNTIPVKLRGICYRQIVKMVVNIEKKCLEFILVNLCNQNGRSD